VSGPGATVLRGGLVFDGGPTPPRVRDLWIAQGRIVGPATAPIGREESLAGLAIGPGLIDAHVHLCLDESPDPLAAFRAASSETLAALMRVQASRTLAAGVTTVRDLGAPTALIVALRNETAAAIGRGAATGPRIIASGAPITSPGGHVHEMGGAVRGVSAVRDAVHARRAAGVDVVKVMATGGGSSPQTDPRTCQFDDDEMAALVDEAAHGGRPVACHAHADAGIAQAVRAGVSTIEHGSYASEASLRAMAERTIALVPTLAPAVMALARDLPAARRAAVVERFAARQEAVRAACRLGVRLVAGTDAGVAFTPHGGVAAEIVALAACEIPVEIALAATWHRAAQALDCADIGTLAPGAHADLIVLEADPRTDPRVLARPRAVMLAGRWVPRSTG
jgi:imidazolonepropionase-like amidohydrolase